jgi:hypothetical protein
MILHGRAVVPVSSRLTSRWFDHWKATPWVVQHTSEELHRYLPAAPTILRLALALRIGAFEHFPRPLVKEGLATQLVMEKANGHQYVVPEELSELLLFFPCGLGDRPVAGSGITARDHLPVNASDFVGHSFEQDHAATLKVLRIRIVLEVRPLVSPSWMNTNAVLADDLVGDVAYTGPAEVKG